MTKLQQFTSWLQSAWTALYTSTPPAGFGWIQRAWAAILYLLGILFWGQFLNWGAIPFDFQDWAEISAARVAFVRDALTHGVLPLHMVSNAWLRTLTDRYFVLPDVISSPQMVLLWFLQTGPFILVSTLLMYTLGVAGLLWLRRKFSLSPVAFTLLFFLFNFNGHLQAHLAVGHVNWVGNFLFPWLLVLSIALLDRPQGWRWIAATAGLLFLLLLNGSFHQFMWCLMFLGLLAIAAYRRFFTVFKAVALAGLLSAVRLLPPILGLGHFSNEFISGYPSLYSLEVALIGLRSPLRAWQTRLSYNRLGFWELDLYVGIAGALLLLYFGIFVWLRNNLRGRQYPQLLLPVVVLLLLSQGSFYEQVMAVPFPLVSAERVSSRMIILPFLVIALFASVNFQNFLDRGAHLLEVQLGSLGALAYFGRDIFRHFQAWQVTQAYAAFPVAKVDLARNLVGNHPDAPYTNLLILGGVISILTGLFLVGMAWREAHPRPAKLAAERKLLL